MAADLVEVVDFTTAVDHCISTRKRPGDEARPLWK